MNKNRQKNLFRQNLNINNKNMHENISTQQSNRTADIIKSSLPSTEGRDRILISHLPAVSQCASYLFSTWLTFPCPEFCNCTGDPLRLQRGKAWRLNGFKLFIPAERWKTKHGWEKAERREYKRKTWQRTQHKHCLCTKECGQRGDGLASLYVFFSCVWVQVSCPRLLSLFFLGHKRSSKAASGLSKTICWHFSGLPSGCS